MLFRFALLTLLFFAQNAFAAEALEQWVDQTVSYEACNVGQKTLIRSSLVAGLTRVATFNANLLNNRILQARGFRATYNCDPETNRVIGAAAQASVSEYRSVFGVVIGQKRLRNAVIKVGSVLNNRTAAGAAYRIETILLHEFLHFLYFDNLDSAVHNQRAIYSVTDIGNISEQNVTFDVVQSCAAAAFSDLGNLLAYARDAEYSLKRLIQTCQDARIENGKVELDTSSFPAIRDLAPTLHASFRCLTRSRASPILNHLKASELAACQMHSTLN